MAISSALTSSLNKAKAIRRSGSRDTDELDVLINQLDDTSQKLYNTTKPEEKTYYQRIIDQLQKRIAQIQMFDSGLKGIDMNDKRADELTSAEVSDLSSDPQKFAKYLEARFEAIGNNPLSFKDEFMAFLKAAPKIAKNPDFLIAVGKSIPAIAPYVLPYAYALKYKKYALIVAILLGVLLGLLFWLIAEFWKEDKLALIQEMLDEPECENVGNYFIGGDTDMDRCVITLLGNRIKGRVEALNEE